MSEAEKEEEDWMLSDQNTEYKLHRRKECLARVDMKRIQRSTFFNIRASIFWIGKYNCLYIFHFPSMNWYFMFYSS